MPNIPFPQCILVVTGTGKTKGGGQIMFYADPATKVISRLSSRLGATKSERKHIEQLV